MKEPKFVCTFTQSQELLKKYYYHVKHYGLGKWLWLGIMLMIGSAAIYITTRDKIDLIFLVVGACFAVKELITPFRSAKKAYKLLTDKYGENLPEMTVSIDEKKAVCTFDGTETTLLLEDVLGLYFCKDIILLKGFSDEILLANVENLEECRQFLDKHCKNAPVYKR